VVILGRSGLTRGELVDGWIFVCHQESARRLDLHLPGFNIEVRVRTGTTVLRHVNAG